MIREGLDSSDVDTFGVERDEEVRCSGDKKQQRGAVLRC